MPSLLIVDDDPAISEVLYDLFVGSMDCRVASTAEQALRYLRDEHYDVILTDISMPGLTGVELLGKVRKEQPGVGVIVVTGIDDPGHKEGLLRLGAEAYITKPFRIQQVEEAVCAALERRERSVQVRRGAGSGEQA